MYQGKFDKKNKRAAASIPVKKNTSAPGKGSRGFGLGGYIFYTVFFLWVFLFYAGVYWGLLGLRDWLTRYELAQPTTKSGEVFESLFSHPDWEALYELAGIQDTAYESKDAFAGYMESTVGDEKLTYMETSTGLSEDKKYIVRLGKEKIASFTLADHNHAASKTEIPDWQLETIEFYFAREESYRIRKLEGHTVYVNNVPLDDSATIRISTTNAEEYLPEGISGIRVCTQEVSGLIAAPDVRITDGSGKEMAVSYDAASRTFTEQTTAGAIGDPERETAINAVKTYALYMIKQAGEGDVAKYFLRGSEAYNSITDTERGFVQDAASRDFANETVTDDCRYTDDLFSVRVSVTLNQHRASGSVKESVIDQSLFFEKQSSGKWLCFAMTAVDVSKPVERVRLTFRNGDTILESDFYDADSAQLMCPVVSSPDGKVFSGWVTEETDESGNPVMSLVFQPDETGKVTLPAGTTLEPMTLYPLFG